jgi:hypothetical protein
MDEAQAQVQRDALQQWLVSRNLPATQFKQLDNLFGLGPLNRDALAQRLTHFGRGGEVDELVHVLNTAIATASSAGASAPSPSARTDSSAAPAGVHAGGTTDTAGVIVDYTRPEQLQDVLDGFSLMDYTGDPAEPVVLRFRTSKSGIEFRWTDNVAGRYRVFRLVSSDVGAIATPDRADTLVVTTGGRFTDPRPMTSAVRRYQLWVNTGDDLESAQWEQPAKVGEASVVAPPHNVVLQVEPIGGPDDDRSQVRGQWTLLPGARAVQIYRIPAAQAAVAGRANPAFRINPGDVADKGFADSGVAAGSYHYQFVVEADVDGLVQLSTPPLDLTVSVPARLRLIDDLACVRDDLGNGSTYTLSWTAPASGQTVLYRTESHPLTGTLGETHPAQGLPHLGLPENRVVVGRLDEQDGVTSMPNVALPEGWPRAYFTAVHVVEGQARIGATVLTVEPGPVTDVQIHQRISRQIVTFGWPVSGDGGADSSHASVVSVFESPKGTSARAATSGTPIATASKTVYDDEGGIVLTRPLNPKGSILHLVPYAFAGQQPVPGPPAAVEYPGLLCIRYRVDSTWKLGLRKRRRLVISITADRDLASSPRFALIHKAERLPLSAEDGTAIPVWLAGDEASEPVTSFRPSSLTVEPNGEEWQCFVEQPGFVRLFGLNLQPEQLASVAVLDPPIRDLQCLL